jgi:hypothetical protein
MVHDGSLHVFPAVNTHDVHACLSGAIASVVLCCSYLLVGYRGYLGRVGALPTAVGVSW